MLDFREHGGECQTRRMTLDLDDKGIVGKGLLSKFGRLGTSVVVGAKVVVWVKLFFFDIANAV